MSGISTLAPTTEDDYARIAGYIANQRGAWQEHLETAYRELEDVLEDAGYEATSGEQLPGDAQVAVSCRLKETEAIIGKMRRFGEPLSAMLDVWGYRLVVPNENQLDAVAQLCADMWATPTPDELLLRHGQLQFDWRRDYRRRDHAGLSPATTASYDQAIHLNRTTEFGIVEIQTMTADLYVRAHLDPTSKDNHERFVARREALFEQGPS